MAALKNAKHEAFLDGLLKGATQAEAYLGAGYKATRRAAEVEASKLLRKPEIAARYAERRAKLEAKVEKEVVYTKQMIMAELAKLGFSNMLDYVTIKPNGLAEVDLSRMSRDQAAALTEVKVEKRKINTDEEEVVIDEKVTIKIADKRAALVNMGQELGMFKTAPKGVGAGAGGGDNEGDEANAPGAPVDRDAARRIAYVLAKAVNDKQRAMETPAPGKSARKKAKS